MSNFYLLLRVHADALQAFSTSQIAVLLLEELKMMKQSSQQPAADGDSDTMLLSSLAPSLKTT